MQRDTIVYFGIIQFEFNNAMCRHAEGIRRIIIESGYRAIIIGVSPTVNRGQFEKRNDNTYVVNDPQNIIDRIRECLFSSEIREILNEIGLERIKTFIMADFRYIPMKSIERYCEHNGIFYVVDIMDRFITDEDFISKIKKFDISEKNRKKKLCAHTESCIFALGNHGKPLFMQENG